MKVWIPRVFALLALAAVAVAIYLAISSVDSSSELSGADAQAAMQELAGGNGALSDKLDALSAGDSPSEAQDATRTMADLTHRLEARLDEEGDMADRVRAVYAAELAYLNAVGSTLNNPSSELRTQIGPTAQAL